MDGQGRDAGGGAGETKPQLPGLSTLLADLARTPDRGLDEARARGPRVGDVVGRFELLREVGRGGFGVVFEARDRELNRSVAFKVIRPGRREQEPVRAESLRREAEAVAQLSHPNIVTLFDAGRCDSGPWLVFELLDGETLDRRMERGPMAAADALRVALGIARALVHAHARGVLHRDLKPGNVFLAGGGVPKVLDFGLAHVFGVESPRGAGTPGYMAPEQRRGEEEDARADVWAVGVILWEMLSGRRLGEQDFLEGGGAPPRPAGAGIPAALEELVARCLSAEAAGRPGSAVELCAALEAIAGSAARRSRLRRVMAAALAAAAIAGATGWYLGVRKGTGTATRVAVADARNETGSPQFDGIAGMLQSSLEQSRRLAVVPRARLLSLRDSLGLPAARRVEPEVAREVAERAGARLLLQLAVARRPPGFALTLAGIDPDDGRVRFTLTETAPDEPAVPAAVDRLSHRVRTELGEPPGELRGSEVALGKALTTDLEAYRHYFLGEQCAARPVYGQDCSPHFRRAAQRDPAFAAAHYQLSLWSYWFGGPRELQLAAIAEAGAHAADAPEKDRLLIRAWDAWLHGRDDEALAAYATYTVRFPQDPVGWFQRGELLRRREELAAAVPWFEKAVEVDPEQGWALAHLAECLGATGRTDELRRRIAQWEAAPGPAALHALVIAHGWLGDLAAAERAARRAASLGGGVAAREDLLAVWTMAGRYGDVEAAVRALAQPGSEVRPMGYLARAAMAAYRGRRAEGLKIFDALAAALPEAARTSTWRNARLDYLLGGGDRAAVRREVEALAAVNPITAAEHAAEIAWLGDATLAASLAAQLPEGSIHRRTHDAVARVRSGAVEEGLAGLREIAAASPVFTWRVAPSFLLGALAAEAGRCDEAVEPLRRFQGTWQPLAMWRSWALPRSRELIARCEAAGPAR
jgi:tetratricopeptide (TPR) repeat protein